MQIRKIIIYIFKLNSHLFLGVQLIICYFNTGVDNGWPPSRRQAIPRTNHPPVHLCIYVWGGLSKLTHWGRVTHICVSKLTIIGSDNGLSPDRRQAIIRTNAEISLIWNLGTSFSEIFSEIHTFLFKKMHLKNVVCEMASIWSRPQCVKTTFWDFLFKNPDVAFYIGTNDKNVMTKIINAFLWHWETTG